VNFNRPLILPKIKNSYTVNAMDLNKLEQFLKDNNQPKFRLEQIKKAVYQDGISTWSEITTIPKELRELLDKEMKILSFEIEKVLVSKPARNATLLNKNNEAVGYKKQTKESTNEMHHSVAGGDGQSIKAALNLPDNNYIETVLLSSEERSWTVCVSSQAGCPLNCAFCATGREGFNRNLTAEEITDQILFWRQYLKKNFRLFENCKLKIENCDVKNIVYMGMGEPFLNWEQVKKSLEDLIDPKFFGFGSRSISVSTSGIPEGIEIFTETFPQMNLAVSLHFAENEMRSRYMPINNQYDLEKIKERLQKYFQKSKRKVFIEYILFQGLNDSLQDAKKLSEYLKSIGHTYLLHVNLIFYNEEDKTANDFKASSRNAAIKFKDCLQQNHINVTIRKSLGTDIQGACGQLAAH